MTKIPFKDFAKLSDMDLLFYVTDAIEAAFTSDGITAIDTGTGFGQRDMTVTLGNRAIVIELHMIYGVRS